MTRRTFPAVLPNLPGLFFLITFIALVFIRGEKALIDGDTFWHIKAGLAMLEKGSLLTRDLFSHTAYGTPWTAHEWLAEFIMALVYRLSGLPGVAIFYFFIASLSLWLLFRIALRYCNEWIALICMSVVFGFSLSHLLARPHIFTWLFGIATLYLLLEGGRKKNFLPLITALWANFHGGFILGLALQGIFIAGPFIEHLLTEKKLAWRKFWIQEKSPILVLLASLLASGINPFGYHLLIFPFLVTSEIFSSGIGEWLSPNMQKQFLFRWYLLGFLFLLSLSKTKSDWKDRLLILFFFNAALVHQRNISIASMFLTPYLAQTLNSLSNNLRVSIPKSAGTKDLRLSKVSGPLMATFFFVLLMVVVTPIFPTGMKLGQALIPIPQKHPIEAVKFLNATPLSGKMFNEYSWGGYLIYALNPPQKVFIDGRADMYGEKIFGDYRKIISIDGEIEELLENYEINWVLYPYDSSLVRYLSATGQWKELYRDEEAAILVRKGKKS